MKKAIEVQGIVTPYYWDADSNIVQISLNAEDETVYLIEPDIIGKSLEKYIQKRVRLRGELNKDPLGIQKIKIDEYSVLPWLSFKDSLE